jgi:hypothetical protein
LYAALDIGILKQSNRLSAFLRVNKDMAGSRSKYRRWGELLRVKDSINNIIPETDGIPLIWVADGNSPVLDMKPKDVLPPEGAFFPCQMGNKVAIILLPNESNPLNIILTIELI